MRENLFIFNFKGIFTGIKILLFTAAVVAACLRIGESYQESSSRNKINEWNRQRFADFYDMRENTVDMVFVGSSHSYCTFDPEIIDRLLGVNSFQMGMPLQHPDSTYYTLLEIGKGQRPDTVVMEVYWDMLDEPFELKQADAFFQVLRDKELQKDYIKNVFPLSEKVKYYMPVIRYQQDFLAEQGKLLKSHMEGRYGLKIEEAKQEGREGYATKGFIYCDYVITDAEMGKTNQFLNLDGRKWQFDPVQKKYLEKIVRLCREKNMRLVFVTAPVANASMDKIQNYQAIHEQVASFAEKNGVPYLDFNIVNEQEKLFTNENFRDDAHLNYSGVEIADAYFAGWLQNLNN